MLEYEFFMRTKIAATVAFSRSLKRLLASFTSAMVVHITVSYHGSNF